MATGITIKVDVQKLQQLAAKSPNGLENALAAVAEEISNDVKLSMTNSPASGRTYGSHVASSPGNPPRPDIGALVGSIRPRKTGRLSHRIEDGVEYGIDLEVGTEKIEPRPFMRTAFEEYQTSKFAEVIREQLGI